jgi:signal transduction histidine kinase
MASEIRLDVQSALNGLDSAVLIFSAESDGRLLLENRSAQELFGEDLYPLRDNGWQAAGVLIDSYRQGEQLPAETLRDYALQADQPMRFHLYLNGSVLPACLAAVLGNGGQAYLILSIEIPNWSAFEQEVKRFQDEIREAFEATAGHVDLVQQSLKMHKPKQPVETLTKRISGFNRLITIHTRRALRFLEMMERLKNIRTGRVYDLAREGRRKIELGNFLEDFIEELDEIGLLDPETEETDLRARVIASVPRQTAVAASPYYLTHVLRDTVRNAIMYSMKATPVMLNVQKKNQFVQIDVVDQGYGVREKERERVFQPFSRARQPQVISEFGYGLNLYLCKREVEAMNGKMWFESDETAGTTFTVILPAWSTQNNSRSSSDSSKL